MSEAEELDELTRQLYSLILHGLAGQAHSISAPLLNQTYSLYHNVHFHRLRDLNKIDYHYYV